MRDEGTATLLTTSVPDMTSAAYSNWTEAFEGTETPTNTTTTAATPSADYSLGSQSSSSYVIEFIKFDEFA